MHKLVLATFSIEQKTELSWRDCEWGQPLTKRTIGVRPTQMTDIIKGSAFESCKKLIRDTADLPLHSTVISIVERVKKEIGRNRNFKNVFMN